MKKLLAACVCAGLSFSFAGCSPETILEQFTSTGDTSVRELLLHLTPQLKPKQKAVSIWMNFPVPCRIFQEASLF